MTKQDEIDNEDSCWNKTDANEPVFVIGARDLCAVPVVKLWIALARLLGSPLAKLQAAADWIGLAEEWQKRKGGGKVPD